MQGYGWVFFNQFWLEEVIRKIMKSFNDVLSTRVAQTTVSNNKD